MTGRLSDGTGLIDRKYRITSHQNAMGVGNICLRPSLQSVSGTGNEGQTAFTLATGNDADMLRLASIAVGTKVFGDGLVREVDPNAAFHIHSGFAVTFKGDYGKARVFDLWLGRVKTLDRDVLSPKLCRCLTRTCDTRKAGSMIHLES